MESISTSGNSGKYPHSFEDSIQAQLCLQLFARLTQEYKLIKNYRSVLFGNLIDRLRGKELSWSMSE